MFEIYPSNGPVALDPTDPRNRFHRIALDEARITTELRPASPAAEALGLVARLRALLSDRQSRAAEPCACPA